MIILGYHRVNPAPRGNLSVTIDTFRRQLLHLLHKGYRNVSLEEVVDALPHLPRRSFAITFDDGYRDNYLHAMPVLKELGLKATVFITVNYIDSDQPYPWDERRRVEWGGDIRQEDLCLSWAHLREMQDSQIFSIGSHTLSHPTLPAIDASAAWHEISVSKRVLEEGLGRPITCFCYPRGEVDRGVIAMVRDAGFLLGVVTPEYPVPKTNYSLRRIGIDAKHDERQFALKVSAPFQIALDLGIWPRFRALQARTRREGITGARGRWRWPPQA
jgi:peptidoglycan/xylan/chitin deacetylase (PgdA/CDA1 family)